jgi:hypothetical protein
MDARWKSWLVAVVFCALPMWAYGGGVGVGGGQDPTWDIYEDATHLVADPTGFGLEVYRYDLGQQVNVGDVLLFENASGSPTNPASWSDVLRFSENGLAAQQGGTTSTVWLFSDTESGFPTGFALSPFRGLDVFEGAPPTVFDAGGGYVYNVYSDDPRNEGEQVPLPAAAWMGMALLGGLVVLRRRAA